MSTVVPLSQRGMTLVIALVLLMAMTALAVSGLQGAVLQERMARNLMDRQVAFQAAEAALEEGEWRLRNAAVTLPDAAGECTARDCLAERTQRAVQWSAERWRRDGLAYGDSGAPLPAGVSEPPRVTIAVLESRCPESGPSCRVVFGVTAFAWGQRAVTHAVLTRRVTLDVARKTAQALAQADAQDADNDATQVVRPAASRAAWRAIMR